MKRVILVLCAGLPLRAQSQSAPAPGPGTSQRITIRARALDYSTMLRSGHAAQQEAARLTPVPLPEASLLFLVRGLPGEPRTAQARSDVQGQFVADLGDLPPGAMVEFLAERKTGDGAAERLYARSFQVGAAAPPAEVQFYRVARSPAGIVQEITQVVTVKEDKSADGKLLGRRTFLRQIVQVGNFGFEVWLGDVATERPVSYWVPVPEGFELVAGGMKVDQRPVEVAPEVMPHGGRGCAWRQPMFPAFGESAHQFVVEMARPYVEGETIDLGTHVEYPTEVWSLNIQDGVFSYLAGDPADGRVQLADAGARPAMGQSQRVTHAWVGENIRAHATVNGRVVAGKPPLDKAVVIVVGSIVFVVLGGITFGFLLRRKGQVVAGPVDPVAVALRQLDDRKRRGEISSVDYAARKAVLLGQAPAVAPEEGPAPPARPAAELLAQVDAIASRAAGGAEPRVVEDVRILARAVRELLTRRGQGPAPRG
jgi:hypothetical protein